MTKPELTEKERALFARIADRLIPEHPNMPSASQAGVPQDIMDRVLGYRPDLVEPFRRGLAAAGNEGTGLEALVKSDPEAFEAIGNVAAGGYFMSLKVREALGYPGQEAVDYDPDATPDYMLDGSLEQVIARGRKYRPTPDTGGSAS